LIAWAESSSKPGDTPCAKTHTTGLEDKCETEVDLET